MNTGRFSNIPSATYRRIYSQVPRTTVDVVIRTPRGILLSRRSIKPYRGYWHLPGGRVRKFEPLRRAAQRICREELGLRVRVLGVVGTIEYLRERVAPGFNTHSVSTVLAVRPIGGSLRGSWQARNAAFLKTPPPRTIAAVRKFLLQRRLWTK